MNEYEKTNKFIIENRISKKNKQDGGVYCGRHQAEMMKPRCYGCDEVGCVDVMRWVVWM